MNYLRKTTTQRKYFLNCLLFILGSPVGSCRRSEDDVRNKEVHRAGSYPFDRRNSFRAYCWDWGVVCGMFPKKSKDWS